MNSFRVSRVDHLVVMETTISILPMRPSPLVKLMFYLVLSVLEGGLQLMLRLLEDALSQEKPFFSGSLTTTEFLGNIITLAHFTSLVYKTDMIYSC